MNGTNDIHPCIIHALLFISLLRFCPLCKFLLRLLKAERQYLSSYLSINLEGLCLCLRSLNDRLRCGAVRRKNLQEMDSTQESGGVIAVAFEVATCENPNNNNSSLHDIPKRVRRRLLDGCDSKPSASCSLEKIEAKLKEAHLRRQQFHEWLANKARPKPRSPPHPSPDSGDLMQRLQAKLSAAERKRLELLAKSQMRLAKSEEMRQAVKTEVQLRTEREREVLKSKFESREQQAESNRLALLEADKQRRVAAHTKKAQSLMQRTLLEDRDKERVEACTKIM